MSLHNGQWHWLGKMANFIGETLKDVQGLDKIKVHLPYVFTIWVILQLYLMSLIYSFHPCLGFWFWFWKNACWILLSLWSINFGIQTFLELHKLIYAFKKHCQFTLLAFSIYQFDCFTINCCMNLCILVKVQSICFCTLIFALPCRCHVSRTIMHTFYMIWIREQLGLLILQNLDLWLMLWAEKIVTSPTYWILIIIMITLEEI